MLVEIWSDVACPWCYVGKRRLEAALGVLRARRRGHRPVARVRARPPAPAERPGNRRDHLARQVRPHARGRAALLDELAATAAEDGLDLRFDRVRGANTFDAHRSSPSAASTACRTRSRSG